MAERKNPTRSSRSRQRGIATVLVALLLVGGVLFILTQTMRSVNTAAIDTTRQMNSTGALMLAESGIQRMQSILGKAAATNSLQESTCTGLSGTGPFSLGGGTFNYSAATALPSGCNASTNPCTKCTATVTGTVGDSTRSLEATLNFTSANGTTGKGQTITMVLRNDYDRPALALFNLAWRRQEGGGGGNSTATYCANGASDCGNMYHVVAQAGNKDVGALGVSVGIAASTVSKVVEQYLSAVRAYAEVGALFPAQDGATTWPTVKGSYWDDVTTSPGNSTVGTNNVSTGRVNSGVANTTANCIASPNTYGSGSKQTCNSWCNDSDTLVFGISGRAGQSGSVTEQINSVIFNTTGSPSQNVALTRTVHYPDTNGSVVNATDVYAEVWKYHNPQYAPPATTYGATTYPTQLRGTVGSQFATSNIAAGAAQFSVNTGGFQSLYASSRICLGDKLSWVSTGSGNDAFQNSVVITGIPENPSNSPAPAQQCSNTTGVSNLYTFSPATKTSGCGGAPTNCNMGSPILQVMSTKFLHVDTMIGALSASSALLGAGANISVSGSTGINDPNVYNISGASAACGTGCARTTQAYTQGTPSTTIVNMPAGWTAPALATAGGPIIAVASGTGLFAAGTKVESVSGSTFTVPSSTPIVTPLRDAKLCGGICALFNDPSSTSSFTDFTVNKSAGTTYWSGGFMCLSGVKDSLIIPVTSSTTTTYQWKESIQ
jgi:hypothetical protein